MKIAGAGRLFEAALKEAHIDLKPGTEFKVKIKGKHLMLLISNPEPSEFEAMILSRSKKTSDTKAAYKPNLSLGERIQTLRKSSGLTLEKLAKKAGLSKGSLGSIEKDNRSVGLIVLKKIAKALNIPLSILTE